MFVSRSRQSAKRLFRSHTAVVLTALGVLGCSNKPDRTFAVYPVDGQLFFEGQPAFGAVVTFHPIDLAEATGSFSATVRFDGHFVPTQSDGAVGIPAGEYRLTAVWEEFGEDLFAGQYADPEQPLLKLTVKSTVNIIPKINLP